MIYKFKIWGWSPLVTEIFITANNDEEATNVLKSVSAIEEGFYASDTYKNAVEELF